MHKTDEELTFSVGYEQLYKNLKEAHETANMLDEETMIEDKLSAYGHVLYIVGQLHSIAIEEKERAYAERKYMESELYFKHRNGENKEKVKYSSADAKHKAEMDLRKYRIEEREWIKNAKRWENAHNYLNEQINILKKVQNRQHLELSQSNMNRGAI